MGTTGITITVITAIITVKRPGRKEPRIITTTSGRMITLEMEITTSIPGTKKTKPAKKYLKHQRDTRIFSCLLYCLNQLKRKLEIERRNPKKLTRQLGCIIPMVNTLA